MSNEPWWSSVGVDDLDHDQDPLATHLSARRGDSGTEGGTGDEPGDGPGGAGGGHDSVDDDGDLHRGTHDPAICGVCPICRGWTSLEDRHPDVATNLVLAGRHLAMALRGLADVVEQAADDAADGTGSTSTDRPAGDPVGFRPILLDDDPDHDTDHDMGEPA